MESRTAPGQPYWEVLVGVPGAEPATVEGLGNFLWEAGATGVVEEHEPPAARLRAFFPPGAVAAELARRVTAYLAELRGLDLAVGATGVEVRPLVDREWAEAWRAHFRPLAIGDRLLVCPPWEAPEPGAGDARLVVVIEPGRAFGTGSHATTRGCLELLEHAIAARLVRHALDVGTGSGVLAIAAARLGVPAVTGIDVDPDAVAAALANASRNRVGDRVRIAQGALETWETLPVDLVLANLLGAVHVAQAARLARLTAPGGGLIAGGLLASEEVAVSQALVADGLVPAARVEHEDWVTLLLRRST